jgi:hypothetical protein
VAPPAGRQFSGPETAGRQRQRFRSLPLLLSGLLLLLAGLGVSNQAAFRQHVRLIDEKAELHALLADLRSQAAWISGPLAVGRWARERGMVPAPEGRAVREVAPEFPPLPRPARPTGLEMRTVWQ